MEKRGYIDKVRSFFLEGQVSLMYLVIIVSVTGLIGWVARGIGLLENSFVLFPIPHLSALIFIALAVFLLIYLKTEIPSYVSTIFLISVSVFCLYMFLNFFFHFAYDIEKIFTRNPMKIGNMEIDRISPISTMLFAFICIGIWGQVKKERYIHVFVGCHLSLAVFIISSIIIIGYLFNAPLLYGTKVIPVSLPAGINFLIFSLALIRHYDLRVWVTNKQILDNPFTRLLIRSFLPVIIFMFVLDGYLDEKFETIGKVNLTFTTAAILILIVSVTIYILIKISSEVGSLLHKKEVQIRESEKRFRTVADNTFDWEFWMGNDNKFIYISPSCERITGYGQKDFFDNPDLMTQIIYPDDTHIYTDHLNEDNYSRPCDGIDYRIKTRSGEIRWLYHVCLPVYDENGKIIGRRGSGSDITARKNYEIQINGLNDKLKLLNSDKDRFISILGHDLKNPFHNILSIADLLGSDLDTLSKDEIKTYVDVLGESAQLTNKLLEDILMWARSQQGRIPFEPQNFELFEVCRGIVDILKSNASAKNIMINQSVGENLNVYADVSMLRTVILNLVSNAIKFTKPGGKIDINAREDDDSVTISVSDTGVGIPPDRLSKLFDITQVISTEGTAEESGTGLGLLLCKDFIEKHGGTIRVESEIDKGSDFIIKLPK